MKDTPKAGGHRKPGSAAKQHEPGLKPTKRCPTCKGRGTVDAEDAGSVKSMALRRV